MNGRAVDESGVPHISAMGTLPEAHTLRSSVKWFLCLEKETVLELGKWCD